MTEEVVEDSETEIIEEADGEYIVMDIEEQEMPQATATAETQAPRKRNKVANPDQWLANIRKKSRLSGQSYVTIRGALKKARCVREKDCSKCPKKCHEKFTMEERQKIHQAFWGLCDDVKQKLFISTLVEEIAVKNVRTKSEHSRRGATRLYYLRCGRKKVPVCQGFFLATLDISEAKVRNILKNRDETSYFILEDQRGKGPSHRARPEEAKNVVREHIHRFLEEHCLNAKEEVRKKKKGAPEPPRKYLMPAGISVAVMYAAYRDQCEWQEQTPEKEWLYRHLVKTEFNVHFSDTKPRKESKTLATHPPEEHTEQAEQPVVRQDHSEEVQETPQYNSEELCRPIQVFVHPMGHTVAHEVVVPTAIYIEHY